MPKSDDDDNDMEAAATGFESEGCVAAFVAWTEVKVRRSVKYENVSSEL